MSVPIISNLINLCRLIISTLRLIWRLLKFAWRHSVPLRGVTDQMGVLIDEPLAVEILTPMTGALKLASSESEHIRALSTSVGGLLTDPIARPLVRSSLTLAVEALRVTRANTTTVSNLANDVEQVLAAPTTVPLTQGAIALAARSIALAQAHPAELANTAAQLRQLVDDVEPLLGTTVPDSVLELAHKLLTCTYTYRDLVVGLNTHVGLVLNQGSLVGSVLPLMTTAAKATATNSQTLGTLADDMTALLHDPQSILLQAGGLEAAIELVRVAKQNVADMARLTLALKDLLKDPPANPLETNVINLMTKLLTAAKATSADLITLTSALSGLLSTTPRPTVFTLTRKGATLFLNESAQLLTLLENSPEVLRAAGIGLVEAGEIGIGAKATINAPVSKAELAIASGKTQLNGAITLANSVASGVSGLSVPTDVKLTWEPNNPIPTGVDFSGTPVTVGPFTELTPALQPLTDAEEALRDLKQWVDPIVDGLYAAGTDAKDSGNALQQLATAIENIS